MNLETTEVSEVTILRPDDGLDLLGYQTLTEKINELLHADRTKIVIDIEEVTYINSPAVKVLLSAAARAQKAGGALALVHVQGGAKVVLEVSGTLKVLPAYATVEEAVSALAGA